MFNWFWGEAQIPTLALKVLEGGESEIEKLSAEAPSWDCAPVRRISFTAICAQDVVSQSSPKHSLVTHGMRTGQRPISSL
jgi:hypothetical protein